MENIEKLQKTYKTNSGENPKGLSPLVLAYVGDAVFEIFVRTYVLSFGNAPVNKLHKKSREIVKAKGQKDIYFKIEKMLTEEEQSVFKRGRNSKSNTMPKNADLMDYKYATGLEALFGYLYLKGDISRLEELFNAGVLNEKEN